MQTHSNFHNLWLLQTSNGACHHGGHNWNYYPGSLSLTHCPLEDVNEILDGLVPSGDKPLPEPMLMQIMSPYCVTRPQCVNRADSRFAPSQWETALLCNNVSHWLGASLESALCKVTATDLKMGAIVDFIYSCPIFKSVADSTGYQDSSPSIGP